MCVIRQLINQHSIIDSFPKVLVEFDRDVLEENDSTPDLCTVSVSSGSTSANGAIDISGLVMTGGKQKIAQDVNIFKGIAASMPPKALFHLLRGAASASVEEILGDDKSRASQEGKTRTSTGIGRRRVRFELDRNNENGFVKCYVRTIPRVSDPSLWWQRDDFSQIRREAGTVAENYRRYHKDYTKAIVQLLDFYAARQANGPISQDSFATFDDLSNQKQELVNSFLQCMSKNYLARGLELHIVRAYDQKNKEHNDAVLNACDRDVTDDNAIRRACLLNSRISRRMAYQFATYDTKEALNCLVTPWGCPWAVSGGGRPPLKPTRSSDPIIPLPVSVD